MWFDQSKELSRRGLRLLKVDDWKKKREKAAKKKR
jgi:hypothetical protein